MTMTMNERVLSLLERLPCPVGADWTTLENQSRILDCGVKCAGSLEAGRVMARACLGDLGEVTISSGRVDGTRWPTIQVVTDSPVQACLQSQYAGWRISRGDYFAMGSGPMRARAAREELFSKLSSTDQSTAVVGVLETGKLPNEEVAAYIAERCQVTADRVTLLVAPTASLAGSLQVVARSVETAMHKLFELGFDVNRVKHGFGTSPLPPVAKDDLQGIGRTNDAILYGGSVTLWVTGDDDSVAEIGARVPASTADCYGRPFLDIFRDAGHDFYKIDPMLFSPGEIVFHNIETGRVFRFGGVDHAVLKRSFGL